MVAKHFRHAHSYISYYFIINCWCWFFSLNSLLKQRYTDTHTHTAQTVSASGNFTCKRFQRPSNYTPNSNTILWRLFISSVIIYQRIWVVFDSRIYGSYIEINTQIEWGYCNCLTNLFYTDLGAIFKSFVCPPFCSAWGNWKRILLQI